MCSCFWGEGEGEGEKENVYIVSLHMHMWHTYNSSAKIYMLLTFADVQECASMCMCERER